MSNSSILRKLFPKSLSQEVIEVFAGSPAIKKLGHNDAEDYDYLMIQTICQDFKKELFARGVMIASTDADPLFEQISEGKDTFSIRCTIRTKFEARRMCWFGMQRFDMGEAIGAGLDTFDNIALSIAQTFAYKAMLKRSSMTYGEKDDAEAQKRTDDHQQRTWDAAVRDSGMTVPEISALLSKKLCTEVHAENVPKLGKAEFDTAVKWLLNHRDLSSEWSAEVIDINSRKAQPVVACMDAARDAGY